MPESLTFATAFGPASRLQAQAARFRRRIPRWFIPSFVDLFFLVLVATVFGRPGGWQSLLADGDTGWHIRTGELVLRSGRVPFADVYSFSRAGEPWIAWEWLSDVLFALVYGWRGTGGVAAMSGVVLCLAASALFARLLRRGCGLVIGLGVTMAVVSASSIHYLARPHVFSILFYTLALWALDEDRQRQCWRVWLLVPATAIWANLHAGFVALPATHGPACGSLRGAVAVAQCMPLCLLRAAVLWGRAGQSVRIAAVFACFLLSPCAVDSGSGSGVPVAEHTLRRDGGFRGPAAGGCGHGLAFLRPWRVV